MSDKIENDTGEENIADLSKYKDTLTSFSKTALAKFGAILLATSIVTVVANVAIVTYFLSELTDQLDQRIIETNSRLDSFQGESNRLRNEAISLSTKSNDIISEIRERLARIEAQTELSSSILIGIQDGDASPMRLEEQFPSLDDLLEEFAPIGGPGSAVVMGFPPARKLLPFDTPINELERQKLALSRNFELALTGGFGEQLDPERQMIETRHGLFYNGNEDEFVVVLVAYVVEK